MAKRSEKEIRKEQVGDLRAFMGIVGGRRFVLRLLEDVCGMSKSVMRVSGGPVMDRERLVYNAAKQDVAHWLREEVKGACPIEYERMLLEAETQKAIEAQQPEKKSGHGEMEEEQNGD